MAGRPAPDIPPLWKRARGILPLLHIAPPAYIKAYHAGHFIGLVCSFHLCLLLTVGVFYSPLPLAAELRLRTAKALNILRRAFVTNET